MNTKQNKSLLLRLISCMAIVAVCVLTFSITVFAAITPSKPTAGTGTTDDPYQISTAGQLYWYALLVNSSTLSDSEKLSAHNAVLTNNIVINNKTITSSSTNVTEWTPINDFNAVFDGKGYTISGLYCKDTTGNYAGLFGNTTTSSAVIENVNIVNSYISGSQYVGAICGYNKYGSILNCSNSGTVEGKSDSTSDTPVGGICGELYAGTIKKCSNSGAVSGKYAGGILVI